MEVKRSTILMAGFFCCALAQAADRYWVATGASAPWNTTASWSASPGGASGASIPGNGDQAIFDGNKATPCILTAAVSVSSITISTSASTGYAGYIDLSTRTLTVQQNFTLNAGTFYARTSSMTVGGNWTESTLGNFVANTSSVTFSATTANHLIDTGNAPFYKLIFNGLGGGWNTTAHAVTVSSFTTLLGGNFTVADTTMTVAGDFQVTAGSTLSIKADLEVDGGNLVVLNASNITANSTSTLRLSGTGTLGGGTSAVTLPGVSLLVAGTTTLGSKITILGSLTNAASHTFDVSASNYGITISSGWVNSGPYTSRTGSVTFNGSMLNTPITTGGKTFYNLSFNGTGSWTPLGGPITVTSSTYITGGTFSVADSSLTSAGNIAVKSPGVLDIENDILINGGGLTNTGTISGASTPTVTLALAAGTLGGTGVTTLPALTMAGAFTTTLGGAITVQGPMTNPATHTLDVSANNFAITVSSNWVNSGTYTARSGSVTFNGAGLNQTITTTGKTFYNLNFNGLGSWAPSGGPITVTSSTYVVGGTFHVATSSLTSTGNISVTSPGVLDIQNDVLVNGGGLTNSGTITSASTPTVTLALAAGTLGGTGTTTLPALTLAGAFVTTLGGPITVQGTLTNPATHTLDASASNFGITISSNWANAGIYTARTSSVTFTGSIPNGTIATNVYAFYNLLINGGVWRNITNTVTVSSSVQVNGGTFKIGGSSLTVAGDIDVNAGAIFDIGRDVLINGGDFTNDGTITALSTPTVTLNGSGVLGGAGNSTYPQLILSGAAQTTTLGGPVVFPSSTTIAVNHTLDVSASNYQVTISSWFANNGTFLAQTGTVLVNSTATLTGSTTFYNFTSTTPGITITLQAGTTQYITNAWTIAGASGNLLKFRSTTAAAYTFRVSVSSFVSYVDAQSCVASSQTIYAGKTSTNSGSNVNWIFDYPPNAISSLSASAPSSGGIQLNWNAPVDNDDAPLGAGSRYLIEWSTYTEVIWSTSTVGDTGNTLTAHLFISTSGVTAGTAQVMVSTGQAGSVVYYFQMWTMDPSGNWSQGLSNQATATPLNVLGITLTAHTYDFGTVNLGATTVSTSAVTVTNAGNVTETYSLAVTTTGPSGVWGVKVATPTVMDQFVLFGGFNSGPPSPNTFFNNDAMTTSSVASTPSVFAIGQNGVSTAILSTRDLWMRLDMPLTTSTTVQQQLTVTITASTP